MKKRIVSILTAAVLATVLLAGCGGSSGSASSEAPAAEAEAPAEEAEAPAAEAEAPADIDYGTGEIKIWVADNIVDFTNNQVAAFMEAHPEFAGYTVTVEPVGEGDAAGLDGRCSHLHTVVNICAGRSLDLVPIQLSGQGDGQPMLGGNGIGAVV